MALILKASVVAKTLPVEAPKKSGFDFKAWYAKNKVTVSEKRRKKYAADAEHREKLVNLSREYRKTNKKAPIQPDHGLISFTAAAEQLGVSIWTLRGWREKDYYPEPKDIGGRLWFTAEQLGLLATLRDHFAAHGNRTTEANKAAQESVVSLVYANWL